MTLPDQDNSQTEITKRLSEADIQYIRQPSNESNYHLAKRFDIPEQEVIDIKAGSSLQDNSQDEKISIGTYHGKSGFSSTLGTQDNSVDSLHKEIDEIATYANAWTTDGDIYQEVYDAIANLVQLETDKAREELLESIGKMGEVFLKENSDDGFIQIDLWLYREKVKQLESQLNPIKKEVSDEVKLKLSILRQLINEEFVHTSKQITTQNIYDILEDIL